MKTEQEMDIDLAMANALALMIFGTPSAEFSTALLCKFAEHTAEQIGLHPTLDILDIVHDTIITKYGGTLQNDLE